METQIGVDEGELEAGDCDVCIDSWGADFGPEFSTTYVVRARKEHRCFECRSPIARGAQYERVSGKWDGEMQVFTTCLPCAEVRTALCCSGWIYGSLWEDAADSIFRNLTTGCLAKLKTAAAKDKLLARWREWKGLAA